MTAADTETAGWSVRHGWCRLALASEIVAWEDGLHGAHGRLLPVEVMVVVIAMDAAHGKWQASPMECVGEVKME